MSATVRSCLTMRYLASIALLATLGIATRAHAGGTSSGSSESSSSDSGSGSSESSSESSSGESSSTDATTTGTDTTSTDTTGTDTTGTSETTSTDDTTSDTGTVDDTTGGGCSCATGDESIAIDTPSDGAMVDAPFLVSVDVVPRCPCFDCSCAAEDFEYTQLFLDTLPWGGPCYASPCEWEVTATLGSHELLATATYPSGYASETITVNVVSIDPGTTGDPTTDPTTSPPGSDSSTSGYAGEAPPSNGCGCASDATNVHGLASMLLLVLGTRRRRRS